MKKTRSPGLDELMIVNPAPGTAGDNAESRPAGHLFLGSDGTLYQIGAGGAGEESFSPGQFFLGDDGTLYELVSEPERKRCS